MHIDVIDDLNVIIYLNHDKFENIDLNDKDDIEAYFKSLFNKLKDFYNININGYYDINIYHDKFYGIILDLKKLDIDYIDYFDNQVEMSIRVIENTFLYQIDDIFWIDDNLLEKLDVISLNNKLYIKLKSDLNNIEFGKLIEFGKIIYSEEACKILQRGTIIKNYKKYLTKLL